MDCSPDELAGIVDLFGALDRPTLRQACVEIAFKRGEDHDPEHFDEAIDEAIADYYLLAIEDADVELLVAGPVAFPELPDGATDLPHILDVEDRSIGRDRLASAAEERFRGDAARAIDSGDADRIEHLLDVSYELDVWAPVDLEEARDRLSAAIE